MTPQVSVCIPVYQGERHLRETLDSVLAQEGLDFEVVVIDNASTDGSAEILAGYDDSRLRVVRHESTVPMTDNFRAAVGATRGEFVKLLCADDLLLPGCLAAQAAVLRDDPAVAVVACRRRFVDDDGTLTPPNGLRGLTGRHSGRQVARWYVRWGINPVGEPACVMFRRADYEAVGGWLEDLPHPSDLGTWLRLLYRGDLMGQPDAYAVFRIGADAHSQMYDESNRGESRTLMDRVAADPAWGVTPVDHALGRVTLPLTWALWRLRRRRMFSGRSPQAPTDHPRAHARR